MKKLLSITAIIFGTLLAFAQAPEKMSYQAIIRNASGQLLQNQNIAVKASILQGSSSGTVVYSERLTGTTNTNGLLSTEIGSGTVLSGTFSTINWSTGNYWLKTETDPTGGTNYSIAGTSQLLSVPYAMYAKTSGSGTGTSPWTTNGNNIYNSNSGNVGIGTNNPSEKLDVNGKTKTTNLQVTNGAATGKTLTSDANGNASWSQIVNKGTLTISPFSFVSPENNHYLSVSRAYFPTQKYSGSLIAQVNIPNGATITGIKIYFIDNSVEKDYQFSFTRVMQQNVFPETIASSSSNSFISNIQMINLSVPSSTSIDNNNYFYYIIMSGDFLTQNEGISGARITYTYPVNN